MCHGIYLLTLGYPGFGSTNHRRVVVEIDAGANKYECLARCVDLAELRCRDAPFEAASFVPALSDNTLTCGDRGVSSLANQLSACPVTWGNAVVAQSRANSGGACSR
jgi:hypothetical protein